MKANAYPPEVWVEVADPGRENRSIVATSELYKKLGHGPRNPYQKAPAR